MMLLELDAEFKKAKRIDFDTNLPCVNIYFETEIDADVFYAQIGEYFDGQKLAADFDIRNGYGLTIFSINTGDEISKYDLEFINKESKIRILNYKFPTERFLFSVGYIHNPSGASVPLFTLQIECPLYLERLTIIQ